MSLSAASPYVIGQWVCGPKFFGREAEITDLLGSPQRWRWIAGLRRIGKTSLLKQLDFLTAAGDRNILPLFWDLQGVGSAEDLGLTFTDALLDADEALTRHGISPEEIEDEDVFAALEKLADALRHRGLDILLLCDEADELMPLDRAVPGIVEKLWQTLAGLETARVVLASSLRLCDHGSDLMKRFEPPRYLGVLTDDEARALLRQSPLPVEEIPVEEIRERCGNHPMLLQIVAKRFHELGDLEETFRQVAADRSVQHLFAVDFALLAPAEQQVLRSLDRDAIETDRLLVLGLIHRDEDGGLTVPNRFLASWLRQQNLIQTSSIPQGRTAPDR